MKIKTLRNFVLWACAACSVVTLKAQSQWDPLGQWDFKNGDLSATLGSAPLQYADGPGGATQTGTVFGTTDALGIPRINGTNVNVMKFPVSAAGMGYEMPTPPNSSGGGSLVNSYTIIMDVLFPAVSDNHVRPLVQTDDGIITPDADFVVDSSDGIGVPPGPFNGHIQTNTWYRFGFSVTASEVDEYINGVKVGSQSTGGADGRLALTPADFAQLFQNSTTNGAAIGYVSSIQIQDVALNAGQMAALGGPSASKITTASVSVPSFLESESPTPNEPNVLPLPQISAVLNAGGTVVNSGSIAILLDGTALVSTVVDTGTNFQLSATVATLLEPASIHTASVVYSDSVLGLQTNSWSFSICQYQNVNLPAPIYFENFDEVAEGSIPTGWVATNNTTTLTSGLNIHDTQSDTYKDWTAISIDDYATVYPDTDDYTSPGFPEIKGNRRQIIPPIVENGVLLTNLASGNLIVAESDQRGGNQVQVIVTKDFDFTTQSNVYVSFHNINEQNQDNMCGVEYSVDHGVTWQPLLYMMDDGTTDNNGSDIIYDPVTKAIDAVATFNAARTDQAYGLAFGAFIGAPITQALAPFIRPCRNDDPIQQKRIELFRLPLADHQSAVRLRFVQAGTGSWFFDIDNLGFYSIPQPVISQQPQTVTADYNAPATFSVQASGVSITYQWKFDGTNIVNATNSTYTIPVCLTNNIGLYRVAVSNSYGGVLSDEVPLTLVFTPVVLTPPLDQTITLHDNATLSVSARGGQPLSYQWLFNSNVIAGATGTNYTITNSVEANSGAYQVAVSNQFSTVLSPIAHLNVFAGSVTQDMVVHLTFDNTYADASGRGNNATTVGSPTFEPGFLGEAVHVISSGAPQNAPATNNYVTLGYPSDLVFGSDQGTAVDFSFSFWTKINFQNDDKPFIGNKDWDSGGNPGWVLATQGNGMKWNYRDNAVNTPGVGSLRRDSHSVGPQLEDGGWHHVVVTMARHSVGRIYVDGALLDESALGTDSPTNIVGSADTTGLGWNINIGQDGTGTYTDGGSGAAVDMLVDDLAIWRRVITDKEALGIFNAGLHSNTVDQASTTNAGAMPMITLQPADASAFQGNPVTVKVSSLGTPALAYQWYFGTQLLQDQTNAAYTITNMQSTLQGNYSVVITNSFGSITSRMAAVTYSGVIIPPPTITTEPVSQYVQPGTNVTFSVASSSSGVTYQWFKNGSTLAATNATLVLTNVQFADEGNYAVQLTAAGVTTNSSVALLSLFAGSLNDGLVAYLPFDNDYQDYSGRGHNGQPVGSPSFAPGRIGGGALHFSTTNDLSQTNYVTLGYPSDLQFGTGDFSVGFWMNIASTNHGDDPALIANKNWNSSGNPGWGIFSQGGGNIRVNAQGTSGTKMDSSGTPSIMDGTWHFVLCTFWRGQYTAIYVDGALVGNSPLTFAGSVDTVTNGYRVDIGQDGTGTYTDNQDSSLHIDGLIDEVMLWDRVVLASEVGSLYRAGTNGMTPLMLVTNSSFSSTSVKLNWHGGVPPFTLETSTNLNGTNWIQAGSTSGQGISVGPGAGKSGFYRIRGNTP